jgi:3-oxoacyl-[acyl-carrier protein] reductase
MNLNLENKRAFVCGSTQGIGKAIAIELSTLGAEVILIARNEEKLKQTLTELIAKKGQKHSYICVDFSHPATLKEKVESRLKESGPVHILINNTGGPPSGKAIDASLDEFVHAFKNHLLCSHVLVQAVTPGMKEAGYGRIINIISTSVKQPIPGLGVSNTIRAAVANWAKTLSVELAPFGITVNNVLPGATETSRLSTIIEKRAEKNAVSKEAVALEMQHEIPARRFASASEIAGAAAFLATPAAGYINGINLPVDGGRTASL